ncbi:MAG: ImmA/IrrE family metallo-endopeptidase [Bacteroidetes bacterium]|nr:ImmA/IrrE family metallo-endopeptidase [Bacteroidota bacterium]MBU1423655.1 ImmA/IrrE family metallo-endopeptidase [Bacteroidota bacterium]
MEWTRKRLGLSYKDVEKLSKKLEKFYKPIEAGELKKWELGSSEPELEQLETLSEIFVCPVGYFFLKEQPKESIPLSFRGLSPSKEGKLSPLSHQTLYRFLELTDWTTMMVEDMGIDWEVKFKIANGSEDIDKIVQRERQRLGFSSEIRSRWRDHDEAFSWWRKKIEDQGIFCFQMKLDMGDIRGASVWLDSRYPFILVNHQDIETATGRIFTLLHEYAHLLSSREGLVCDFRGAHRGENPEPFANRFAARMLLSYDEVEKRLKEIGKSNYKGPWSDNQLDEIRNTLFVSRDVIAIMLQEIGKAPIDFYKKKREQWDKRKPFGRGGGGKRPTKKETTLREIGYSLARILSSSGRETSVPLDDLSHVLKMKVEKVPDFLSWARDRVHG